MVELERKLMSTPMTENKQKIGSVIARVPREEQAAQVKENKSPAAGRGALWSSLKELRTHTGLIEGAKLLAKVNQEGGFDCPGCAWPDPPSEIGRAHV